jgi:hypothetical protein
MTLHIQLTQRTDEAFRTFERLGNQLIRSFSPKNVLIVGPVVGLLAETLWERGVPAYCECPDQAACELVRMDVKAFCTIGPGTAPELDYDVAVVVSIAAQAGDAAAQPDIAYLKSRSRSVLFVEIEGEPNGDATASPLLDRIEVLQASGLMPSTTFDATYPGLNLLLTAQDGEALTPSHIADIVRMRRLFRALQQATSGAASAEQQTRAIAEDLKVERAQVEGLKVEALQAQAQLKDAIGNINSIRLVAAQTQLEAQQQAQRQAEHAANEAQRVAQERAREVGELHALLAAAPNPQEIARLNDVIGRLHGELGAVYGSSCWRVTAPIRSLGRHAPIVTRAGRVTAKLIWWTITLQLPRRLRARREFMRARRSK